MKAVKFLGNNHLEIIEKPKPFAKDNIVLVKVTSSGLCATELHSFSSGHQIETTPGHEAVGMVVETDKVKHFKAGDRVMIENHVTCEECEHCINGDLIFCKDLKCLGGEFDGTHAEYIALPEANLRHLPDDISDDEGCLVADAFRTSYASVKKLHIREGEFVGIFGAGPLGHLAALVSKSFGARVIAVEIDDKRLGSIKKYGADFAFNPKRCDAKEEIIGITGGKGLDKAVEIAGANATLTMALDTLKYKGRLVLAGVCFKAEIDPYNMIIRKEIEIVGSRSCNDHAFDELMEFVRKHPKVKEIVTHRFLLEEAQKAFNTQIKGEGLKIVLNP